MVSGAALTANTFCISIHQMGQRGEVFSWRVPSANEGRTYFLNLKENRMGDLYLTIVESKKHGETDFERHQVMFFEEDLGGLEKGMKRVFEFMKQREADRHAAKEAAKDTERRPTRKVRIRHDRPKGNTAATETPESQDTREE